MSAAGALPTEFLERLRALERRYLRERDPRRQSGFSGGPQRWRAERAPLLEAIPASGALLDVGCANGYLLECLIEWAAARGVALTPFGVDCSAALIGLARQRLPQFQEHFYIANAWGWRPPRRFTYVYAVCDCVPPQSLAAFVQHLLSCVTAPGGRLIVGAYGSRARGEPAARIDALLAAAGFSVAGGRSAGEPETARFAWIDAASA
jgi:SAM-dependent methyltransferase